MVLKDRVVRLSSSSVDWLLTIDKDIDRAVTLLHEDREIRLDVKQYVSVTALQDELKMVTESYLNKMLAATSDEILTEIRSLKETR